MSDSKEVALSLLREADVKVGGSQRWDIQIKNEEFYKRVLRQGNLGLGEAYMDGWWECKSIDQFIYRVIRANLRRKVSLSGTLLFSIFLGLVLNLQRKSRAFVVGERHYDIGNDLYQRMLDKRMVYSCGYFKDARSLDEAQEAKLELICRKLALKPGMRVLDIGCGWGSLAKYAAERYKVEVVGLTVSRKQAEIARKMCKGLPVGIRVQDYRDTTGKFDRVVSVGMFEHVGYKNYRRFMRVVRRLLKDDGLFLLHTIGRNTSAVSADPWIHKYVFPNGMLPSAKQIGASVERIFVMEDWHNFGADYEKTLLAWFHNFDRSWGDIKDKYGERFYRMWKYYLLSCAGAFRARSIQLWQVVLSPKGVPGGYRSFR